MNAKPAFNPLARPSNDLLAARYEPLVRRVAARLHARIPKSAQVDYDDTVGAGFVGLLEAASRFDWSRPEEFETFAEFRVKGAILDGLRRVDPMPRRQRQAARRIEAGTDALRSELGREPSRSEVARNLNFSTAEVRMVEMVKEAAMPNELSEFTAAETPSADRLTHVRQCQRAIESAMGKLSEREHQIVVAHFFEETSVSDIATRLGVTKGRVSQLKSAAIGRLREAIDLSVSGAHFGAA